MMKLRLEWVSNFPKVTYSLVSGNGKFLNSWTDIRTLKCYTTLPPCVHVICIKMFVFMTFYTVRKVYGEV